MTLEAQKMTNHTNYLWYCKYTYNSKYVYMLIRKQSEIMYRNLPYSTTKAKSWS